MAALLAAGGVRLYLRSSAPVCALQVNPVGFIDKDGLRCAAFVVTNRSEEVMWFWAIGEVCRNGSWPETLDEAAFLRSGRDRIEPHGLFRLCTPLTGSNEPIRMNVLCEPQYPGPTLVEKCNEWLQDRGLPLLSRGALDGMCGHRVVSKAVQE